MNKAEFTLIEDNGNYAICWIIFNKASDIGKRYNIQGDISLPHFVSKKDCKKIKDKKHIQVNESNLLFGLLLRYFYVPPLTITHKIKPYFNIILADILKEFQKDFGYHTTEECIGVIATTLKQEYGYIVSYQVLKTGVELVPESSKLKSDLVMTVWCGLVEAEQLEDKKKYFSEIIKYFTDIHFEDIDSRFIEYLIYAYFTSLWYFKKNVEKREFLINVGREHVKNYDIMNKMVGFSSIDSFDMKMVKIFSTEELGVN